jgi:hypothetical protein
MRNGTYLGEGCNDTECVLCSMRDCPRGDPLHYDDDGCAAGCTMEQVRAHRARG